MPSQIRVGRIPIIAAAVMLAAAQLACGFSFGNVEEVPEGGGETPAAGTEAPQSLAKPTEEPPGPAEKQPGGAEEGSPSSVGVELADELYVHPSNSFAFYPPAGWSSDEGEAWVTWTAPDDVAWFDVYINPTGVALDADAMDRFITANEENWFGGFDGYQVIDRSIDEFNAYVVDQTAIVSNIEHDLRSIYYQADDVVFEVDFWVESDAAASYMPAFEQIWADMQIDPEPVSNTLVPYTFFTYTFTDDEGYFSFDIPYAWRWTRETGDNHVLDTFWAPDEMAYIDSLKYDDGSTVSKSDAGAFALALLREIYAVDIKITGDKVQTDGSERLTWYSPGGSYSGVSFFETRGTAFLFLTFVADDTLFDTYVPTFDTLLATYVVP